MQKNMTEGNSLKLIVSFALPLLAGNLFQQLYNIVDAIIVGRYLGADALAGVGASSSVQFLVLGFCGGCCTGFGIPLAQRFGANDTKKMRDYEFHAIVWAVLIAALLTVVCAVFCPQILELLQTPDNIYRDAYAYLFIMFLGIPFIVLYNLTASFLRSIGDSKTPFYFLVISTILNIGLDIFCILVLKLGCAGAAIATVVAQAISGILCLILIKSRVEILHLKKENLRLNGKDMGTVFVMGIPMGLQFSITAIGSMVMQSANNGLGDSVYVSAYTAVAKIKQFSMCPFDAIATATANFCSQNLGANKFDRIKDGLRKGLMIAVGYAILMGLVLISFGKYLTMIFINASEVEVIAASAQYLLCMGLLYWLLGFLNVTRMTIQGLGFAAVAIIGGVLEMVARVAVSLIFVPKFGYNAICFTDQSAWFSATVFMVPYCFYLVRKLEKNYKEKKAKESC